VRKARGRRAYARDSAHGLPKLRETNMLKSREIRAVLDAGLGVRVFSFDAGVRKRTH